MDESTKHSIEETFHLLTFDALLSVCIGLRTLLQMLLEACLITYIKYLIFAHA